MDRRRWLVILIAAAVGLYMLVNLTISRGLSLGEVATIVIVALGAIAVVYRLSQRRDEALRR